ncbi:MAG: hypothetical protein MO852_04550 [Candidatus Devosia euplotis]|nr:hypothetical protein [Candidatus Devosia euplotis]
MAAAFAARAAANAAATAHAPTHARRAANYAIKTVIAAGATIWQKKKWQDGQVPMPQ